MIGATAVVGSAGSTSCGVYSLQNTNAQSVTLASSMGGVTACSYQAPELSTGLYVLEFTATSLGVATSFAAEPGQSSNPLSIIVARGASTQLAQHVDQAALTIDLGSGAASVSIVAAQYKTAHAALMSFTIVGLIPVGVFFPAFVKYGYAAPHLKDAWIVWHQAIMCSAVVVVLIALGLVVPQVASPLSSPHHDVGVTVVALVLFNPVLGAVRPHPPATSDEKRTLRVRGGAPHVRPRRVVAGRRQRVPRVVLLRVGARPARCVD